MRQRNNLNSEETLINCVNICEETLPGSVFYTSQKSIIENRWIKFADKEEYLYRFGSLQSLAFNILGLTPQEYNYDVLIKNAITALNDNNLNWELKSINDFKGVYTERTYNSLVLVDINENQEVDNRLVTMFVISLFKYLSKNYGMECYKMDHRLNLYNYDNKSGSFQDFQEADLPLSV